MLKLNKLAVAALASFSVLATSASANFTNNEIRIGYVADMSGAYRDPIGPLGLEAIKMAIDEFGGSINGAKIVTYSADDKNNADLGASIVREWIDQRNVDMVTGLIASSVTLASLKLIEENNKLGLVNGAVSSSITNEHCGPNHFHWVYDTYAMSNGTAKAITQEGNKDWFMLSADYSFGHALENDVSAAVKANGGKVVGGVRHPFPSNDFSSFMLQAQASGAKVISLNNAGTDTINAILSASEFGITQSGQILAGMVVFISDIRSLTLEKAQGLQFTKAWYYGLNDETLAWANKFKQRTGKMPTMVHAGLYSSTRHYLQAVKDVGTDDTDKVKQKMRETRVNDVFAKDAYIREDGRMVHDMYLVRVKSPDEAQHEDDYLEVIRTIPAEEAFRPLSESVCKLVNN